ncbi:hypothetical protein AB0D59_40270 [Streptomyces sp. NPDC048417]|uniref:hypothetical protein n=1 Tax=Streptomyces sp. NPDC048417 TaxID=3155387 RepID=UPI00343335F2
MARMTNDGRWDHETEEGGDDHPRAALPRWRSAGKTRLGTHPSQSPGRVDELLNQMSGLLESTVGATPAVAWTPLADVPESEDAFHIEISPA